MTLRGRLTLAALGFAVGAALGVVRLQWGGGEQAAPAPQAEARTVAEPPPPVPQELLRDPPVTRERFEALRAASANGSAAVAATNGHAAGEGSVVHRLVERITAPPGHPAPLEVEYTLHPDLSERVFEILRRARVELGHVVVLDTQSGRLLVYASTDTERFAPTRAYPAASLIKVVTAAAALHYARDLAEQPCRYHGSPWRLTRSRVHPPRAGKRATLRKALATSNNQCFAQLAVHGLGATTLLDTIARFGLLSPPAAGHAPGSADAGEDDYDLGRLGSGLAGSRITPLHAALLAATLDDGLVLSPRWVERVRDVEGLELALPDPDTPRRVMTPSLAAEMRDMLVDTTRSGTARRAFRTRMGRPLLGDVRVAGKTGSLSGTQPKGRYEWFAGVAPAADPRLAVAVVMVQGDLYWRTASQVAAEVLKAAFCDDKGRCRDELASRWLVEAPDRS